MEENQSQVKDITPRTTEFRDKIDTQLIHEAIIKIVGESRRKNQKLLIIWKGTESSRFATFAFNNSRGWVGQYDTLTPYLRQVIDRGVLLDSQIESQLSGIIIQQISEHSDYKLPMILVIWNPDDSVVFEIYYMNKSICWPIQFEGLITHLQQLSQYTKESAWAQADYMNAQMQLAKQQQNQKLKRPGLVIPQH